MTAILAICVNPDMSHVNVNAGLLIDQGISDCELKPLTEFHHPPKNP